MRSLRFLAVVAVAALTVACAPRPDFAPPVGPRAELRHSGRWLTDEWGRVVNLHGVNFVKKFPPISPAAAGFGADDAAFLHDQGFNVVRLGVVFGSVMPQPGIIDQAYVDSIASTVRVLARENIFTLVAFHQDGYGPLVHGNGFPEWATLTDGLPNPNDPFPTYYLTNPAMQRAFDNFWLNKPGPDGVPLQTHYAEAMRAVAAAVHDEDYVLGYDTFNEPWPGSVFDTCLAPGCPTAETNGTPGLRIPAFSAAIASIVSPRISVWSSPIDVITVTSGASTLVQSSRPPRPTSTTAQLTLSCANQSNPSAVATSKKVRSFPPGFAELLLSSPVAADEVGERVPDDEAPL